MAQAQTVSINKIRADAVLVTRGFFMLYWVPAFVLVMAFGQVANAAEVTRVASSFDQEHNGNAFDLHFGVSYDFDFKQAAILREWVHGRPHRILRVAPVRWLGERSYGFYLWHVAVGLEITNLVGDVEPSWGAFLGLWALCLAGTTLMAQLSFRFVEAPFLRRRASWSSG